MFLKVCFELVFYAICICGFLYQAITTSVTFFSFKITTKISLRVNDPVLIADYAICARYVDLILGNNFIDGVEFMINYTLHHTIEDIFNGTPDPNTIMNSCLIRNPNSYAVNRLNKTACYELFEITKFVFEEYICYELHYKNQSHVFTHLQVSRSALYSKEIYWIGLNETSELNRVRLFTSSAYYPGDWIQYLSLEYVRDVWTMRSNDSYFNYYTSRYQLFSTTNLESPYETNCYDYGESTQEMCTTECLRNRSIELWNAIPSQVIVTSPIPLKQINDRNLSVSTMIDDIVNECKSNYCWKRNCIDSLTSTDTDKNLKSDREFFSFILELPSTPDTIILSEPFMYTTDYVLLILSLSGSWFGFSILALNPYSIMNRLRGRKNFHTNPIINHSDNSVINTKMNTIILMMQQLNTKLCQHNGQILQFQMNKLRYDRDITLIKRTINI